MISRTISSRVLFDREGSLLVMFIVAVVIGTGGTIYSCQSHYHPAQFHAVRTGFNPNDVLCKGLISEHTKYLTPASMKKLFPIPKLYILPHKS
jgi:hypothetical protein